MAPLESPGRAKRCLICKRYGPACEWYAISSPDLRWRGRLWLCPDCMREVWQSLSARLLEAARGGGGAGVSENRYQGEGRSASVRPRGF